MVKHSTKTAPVFRLARFIERWAAYAQGKGYGSTTIKKENQLVRKILNKQIALAVDIGGNVGEYTAEIRRLNPQAEIHTFEPSATNILQLKKRFEEDRQIVVVPWAVSSSGGTATLFSNVEGSGLGSLTKRKLDHFNIDFDVREQITTVRFEDYWTEYLNKRPLDLVKIDIEGHELAALRGFGKAIYSTSVVQFEVGGCNIDTKTFFQDFWYYFKDHNFSMHRITPLGLESITSYKEIDECFSTTNYLAINKV
jgi:FkbM family methyltransferase